MYHIISIGDEAFLYKIFQFLAMLNSSGTDLYARLGLLSALIGIILVILTAITSNGRQFPIGGYIVAIVMFLVFFGQTTSVELEDFYTGRTDIVQDVPLGTAIVGSIVSQAGVAIITYFQTGTSVPGSSTLSPQYALDALMAYRNLSDASSYCGFGTTEMCDWSKTFQSYVANCVLPEYKLHNGWWNGDPKTSSNLLSTLNVPDLGFVTNDYLGTNPGTTSTGQVSDCSNTYSDLNQTWNNSQTGIAAAFSGLLKINTMNGDTPADELGNAFAALGNQTTQPGQPSGTSGNLPSLLQQASQNGVQSVENAVGANLLARGLAQGFRDANQVGEAGVIESAANQRNVQFAAQSTLFTRTLRATMTFFEGVIYGLAPFLAFLIPLGPIGFRYAGRYLQLLVWLFLWMPLLSFVNLFEIMSVLREMNALLPAIGNAPLISAIGLNQIEYTVSDWVGIGAYLTTAVVGLSGFVVFGSVAAFQGIAAEANAPTSLDPSMIAPDIMSTAPPMQSGAQYSASGGSALSLHNAALQEFSGSSKLQEKAMLAMSAARTAAVKLGVSGKEAASMGQSQLQNFFEDQLYGNTSAMTNGATVNASDRNAATLDGSRSSVGSTAVTTNVGGGLKVGGTGAKAGITNTGQDISNRTRDLSNAQATTIGKDAGYKTGQTRALSVGQKGSEGSQSSQSISAERTKIAQSGLNDLQTYSRSMEMSHEVGSSMRVPMKQAAFSLASNSGALDAAISVAHGLDANAYASNYTAYGNTFPEGPQREAAAALSTLNQVASLNDSRSAEAMNGLDNALSSTPGWSSMDTTGVISSVEGGMASGQRLLGDVQAGTNGIPGETAGSAGLPTDPGQIGRVGSGAHALFDERASDPVYNDLRDASMFEQGGLLDKSYSAADNLMDTKGEGATIWGASIQGGSAGMDYAPGLSRDAAAMEGAASLSRTAAGFVVKEQQLNAPLLPTVEAQPPPNDE
ncbi:conjugal transfer protein TraG N-terminal domain-containing protein [Metallibacterium scheffleri]|uniref:TraG N-terminal Proteobacteria domain-containing protein n=1 Tax=Metallibacterium scheffleri TaxID=993689 RepID=A0A4S3KQM5_9GAMM|nr:conjugal transfer protein TraG N-terminal domain-containing protein [Metallibacterium scheffleri]THD11299.1 hypothetical protein B1806_04050 [Metallibacterium scheffleri]